MRLFGGEVKGTVQAVGDAFDKIFTNDEERAEAQAVLDKIAMQPHLLQAEINKIEAQHRSIFIAGWRPMVGWVCGIALAWHFILFDLISWITSIYAPTVTLPQLGGTEQLMTLVVSLLGLGGLRSLEKLQGKTK